MILITGGTGLVGSHLICELLKKGEKIRAFVRTESNRQIIKRVLDIHLSNANELFQKIEWFEGDVTDRMSVYEAIEGIEYVYHCAAVVSFSSKDRKKIQEYNINGTENIVNACLEYGIKKLCFVSSTAALGEIPNHGNVNEECYWKNSKGRSMYSISKYKSEMEVWRGIMEGLDAVIINPSIIIGAGDWKKSSSRMFYEIWKGLKFYTHGVTGYVDIHDVTWCMIQLMEKDIKGEKYILSEGNYSYKSIFEKIARSLGKKKPSYHATPFLTRIAYYLNIITSLFSGNPPKITKETIRSGRSKTYFENNKICNALNFKFKPIEVSIKETAAIFIEDVKNHNIS